MKKKSSCQFSEEGSYWNVTGSSVLWCRVSVKVAGWSKDSWLYSFHLSLASQARGDSWTGAGCLSAPVVYFTCDDGVGWGSKKIDEQDEEWEILNEWLLNAESPSMEKTDRARQIKWWDKNKQRRGRATAKQICCTVSGTTAFSQRFLTSSSLPFSPSHSLYSSLTLPLSTAPVFLLQIGSQT